MLNVLEQGLQPLPAGQGGQLAAHLQHAQELIRVVEAVIIAGAALRNGNGRVDAALGKLAVESDFHVAGALELLEDDFIHAGFRLDEAGGNDGEAAAFLHLAGCAEEFAGLFQGVGAQTAGHGAATALVGIVAAGQTGEGIQHDDDIVPLLHQAAGALQQQVAQLGVAAGGFIEGGGIHRHIHRVLEIGHFLRAFIQQQHQQVSLRIVGPQAPGHGLEQHGLAAAGRSHHQGALPHAQRGDEVEHAHGRRFDIRVLQNQSLSRDERGELVEGLGLGVIGHRGALYLQHFACHEALFILALGGAQLHLHHIAGAQLVLADEVLGQARVILPRAETAGGIAQEHHVVLAELQHAAHIHLVALCQIGARQLGHQLRAGQGIGAAAGGGGGNALQLIERQGSQFVQVDNHRARMHGLGFGGQFGVVEKLHLAAQQLGAALIPEYEPGAVNLGLGGHLRGQHGLCLAAVKTIPAGHARNLRLRRHRHHAHDIGPELHRAFEIQRNIHQEGMHIPAAAGLRLGIQTHLRQLGVNQVIEFIAAFRVILHDAAQVILVHTAVIAQRFFAECGDQVAG